MVTRDNLPGTSATVQAVHAALVFADTYQVKFAGTTIVILRARDELDLCWLVEDARRAGARYADFYEPDLGGQLTAVALDDARLCRKFTLLDERGGEL